MGGAQVAAGVGISAVPYNPASLAYINKGQAYYSKTMLYAGITHSTISLGAKITNTDFIGLNIFYLDSGSMLRTDPFNAEGDGEFSVTGLCARATYSKILTDRLKVGLSLKYIREKIWTASMQTFAVDIGSNFKTGIYGIILGMSVSNFGPEVSYGGEAMYQNVPDTLSIDGQLSRITDKFPIPMAFRCGIKRDININKDHKIIFAMDGINPIDYTVHANIGAEYSWMDRAFVRFGTHLMHDTASFTFGAGAKIRNIHIDYALASYGVLDLTHQFGIRFGY